MGGKLPLKRSLRWPWRMQVRILSCGEPLRKSATAMASGDGVGTVGAPGGPDMAAVATAACRFRPEVWWLVRGREGEVRSC